MGTQPLGEVGPMLGAAWGKGFDAEAPHGAYPRRPMAAVASTSSRRA